MAAITISIGIPGLTNVKALPYNVDFTQVWNGASLVAVATAEPSFITMSEVMVNGVGSGNYRAELPTSLDIINENDGLMILIHNSGSTASVSDPLYGYVPPSCQSTLVKAVTDAIAALIINIDPCELRRALEGITIKPTRTVLGPCQQHVVSSR
jgi:hypothetical protein